jgi:hypothetical protein
MKNKIDFVKIEFHSNENIELFTCTLKWNWIKFKIDWIKIQLKEMDKKIKLILQNLSSIQMKILNCLHAH